MKYLFIPLIVLSLACVAQANLPASNKASLDAPAPKAEATQSTGGCLVVDASADELGTLNLRTGAGLNFEVKAVLHDGDILQAVGNPYGGWQAVETVVSGKVVHGYVYTDYVKGC